MAADPIFFTVPHIGAALLNASNETNLTAPTNVATVITGAAAPGTMIYEVRIVAVATTVAGVINLFLYDGSTYHLFDTIAIGLVTPSATQPPYSTSLRYTNLILPSASWSLRVAHENQAAATCKVTALAADAA